MSGGGYTARPRPLRALAGALAGHHHPQCPAVAVHAGAICQIVATPLNLGRFGNSLALWLGISPAELFLYVFLPPMLLDSAVRIDFYIFRKVNTHNPCLGMRLAVCMLQFVVIPCCMLVAGAGRIDATSFPRYTCRVLWCVVLLLVCLLVGPTFALTFTSSVW